VTDSPSTLVLDGMLGKTIGNYVVRHKLGEGGMGSVYFAPLGMGFSPAPDRLAFRSLTQLDVLVGLGYRM
jgi:hypothetical protein